MDLRTDRRIPVYYIIQPHPGGGLSYTKARHQSLYGPVASGWELADAREIGGSHLFSPGESRQIEVGMAKKKTTVADFAGVGWFDSLVI